MVVDEAATSFSLSLGYLAFSSALAALYVVRFGPTIISQREGNVAAYVSPGFGRGLDDDDDADPPAAEGGAAAEHEQQRIAPLLLRLRVPVLCWLPFLEGYYWLRRQGRIIRSDVRRLAVSADIDAQNGSSSSSSSDEEGGGGGGGGRALHPLAHAAFFLAAARALLADGTMFLLSAQAVCAALSMGAMPPLVAVLPLLSAMTVFAPLRHLASALVAAAPGLLRAGVGALLALAILTAVGTHSLPRACGGTGGAWECTDGPECFSEAVVDFIYARGLREECGRAAAAAAAASWRQQRAGNETSSSWGAAAALGEGEWSEAQEDLAALNAGAAWLPWLQVAMGAVALIFFLGWMYGEVRVALANEHVKASRAPMVAGGSGGGGGGGGGLPRGKAAPRRCFMTGATGGGKGAARFGGSGGAVVGGTGGELLLAGLHDHSAWHYCAFICRVLSKPEAARSPLEKRCVRSLVEGGGTTWMPYAADRNGGKGGVAEEGEVSFTPLVLG